MPPPVGTSANPVGAITPYAKAFRALVAYLQSHPYCSGIRSWRSWTGKDDDDVEPTPAQCPWVRLTPIILPATYFEFNGSTRGAHSPLKVSIETAVADTNFDASALVWANLDAALFPVPSNDTAGVARLKAMLRTALVTDLLLLQPALPTGLASFGGGLIVGDGAIQLEIDLTL